MMREFKFIRGIYKNESVLNQDETKDTLFALYGDGSSILLDTKNDEDFQEKIVGLKSDNREIYTIRPSQFKATATKKSFGNYTFTYDLDGDVYDNSKKFPDDVKAAAATLLGEKTTAGIPDKPSLILSDANETPTSVEFIYDNKSFKKNLYFRVFGDVVEFSITPANDTATAYKMIDGNVSYNDYTTGIFYNGKKQEEIQSSNRDIAKYEIVVNSTGYLGVASQYRAETNFKFLIDQKLLDVVNYSDNLTFDLYNKVNKYLILVDAGAALNAGNSLKPDYVAYRKDSCPSKNCYTENPFDSVFAYSENGCVSEKINDDQNYYNFYEVHEGPAYILIGSCEVSPKNETIVKGYETSYDKLFIIYTDEYGEQALRQIIDADLTPDKQIGVYTGKIESYNVFNNGVYINDPKDKADYVTLSSRGTTPITKDNAFINNEGKVAPQQDLETFRQIVESTLKIEATES